MHHPERYARVLALAARDLMVAVAAAEGFASHLDAFAKRRAALYATDAAVADADYWPGVAAALAPVAPPELMPMASLVAAGVTLEGGARGLRSLFTNAPSDKERRRVQRVAALAARVLDAVAGADEQLTDDEQRAITMTLASFGLDDEAIAALRPPARTSAAQIEVFGELDARVRRELVRGAWQMALRGPTRPVEEEAVRTIAARLDMAEESEQLRQEVATSMQRLGDVALLAVELARGAGAALPPGALAASIESLIRSAAPPGRTDAIRERARSREPAAWTKPAPLARPHRLQAVALAWATLAGTDPTYSMGLHLRGELVALAAEAGAGGEAPQALDEVDRYLHQRVRDATLALARAGAPAADAGAKPPAA